MRIEHMTSTVTESRSSTSPSPGLAQLTAHSYRPPPLLNSAHALQQFWARRTARRLLADQLPGRWAHPRGVGHRAEQVALILPPADRSVLVATAWLHDVGYAAELVDTGIHPLDGARFLTHCGVPHRVCALVAHHSGAAVVAELLGLADQLTEFAEEHGPVRDALWYCDMTTSPDGRPGTFADRIREIRTRRQSDDPVVRALATNGNERAAAVRRTEQLLHTSGTNGEQAFRAHTQELTDDHAKNPAEGARRRHRHRPSPRLEDS
jgi:hypothetical protein